MTLPEAEDEAATPKEGGATIYHLRQLAEFFYKQYGFPGKSFPALFPEQIKETELLAMGRKNLKTLPEREPERLMGWAQDAITFAQNKFKESGVKPDCNRRQVFAAYNYEIVDKNQGLQGSLTVGGTNGMPTNYQRDPIFTPAETGVSVKRMLEYLKATGQMTEGEVEELLARIGPQIDRKILTCREIADLDERLKKACRRRLAPDILPKDFCPSTLCAEGSALANRLIGEIVWQLVAQPGQENVTVMPIVAFSPIKVGRPHESVQYVVYYQAKGEQGISEGRVTLDERAIFDLTSSFVVDGGSAAKGFDLREVRKRLSPSSVQTDIAIERRQGQGKGPDTCAIRYFDPQGSEFREISVVTHEFPSSAADTTQAICLDQSNLDWSIKAIATSAVPCPRCTMRIIDDSRIEGKIPSVVVTGTLFPDPDYYEPLNFYWLEENGIVVVSRELIETQ
jgi:hypothetical protein